MDTALIQQAIQFEEQFAANDGQGLEINSINLHWGQGGYLFYFTAPHAVVHWRGKYRWESQVYTGPLAMQLAEKLYGTAFIRAKTTPEEAPNFSPHSAYKSRIIHEIVTPRNPPAWPIAFDLHGIPFDWKWDILIGTGNGTGILQANKLLGMLVVQLQAHGMYCIGINIPQWAASTSVTIAQTIARSRRVPCFQIAINRAWRNPEEAPEKYEALFSALSQAAQEMSVEIRRNPEITTIFWPQYALPIELPEDEDDENEEAEGLEPEIVSQNDYLLEEDRMLREEIEKEIQRQRRGQEKPDDTPPRRDRR